MKAINDIVSSLAFGTEYSETFEDKIIFSRLSKQERNSLNYGKDDSFSTAGVRLEFRTNSKRIKLAVSTKNSNQHGRNFYSFDLYCDGNMVGQIKNFNKEAQYPYKNYNHTDKQKTFDLPYGMKNICIYFPWSVQGMIRKIELDDEAVVLPTQKKRKIIMYGDSITQGYDSEKPSLSYASLLADTLDANVINKGIGGSGFMPEIVQDTSDTPPDLITVAYGTNNWRASSFSNFESSCVLFFEKLTNNYPDTHIFAIAPIWRADINETYSLGKFSVVADTIYKISLCHKNVHFVDGIDFIKHDKSYYRDGYLHPNDRGFKMYAEALIKEIEKII